MIYRDSYSITLTLSISDELPSGPEELYSIPHPESIYSGEGPSEPLTDASGVADGSSVGVSKIATATVPSD